MCPNFQYFEECIELLGKKASWAFHLYEMERYGYGLDRQVLDADPNPKKDADPTGSGSVLHHYGTQNINLMISVNTLKTDLVNL